MDVDTDCLSSSIKVAGKITLAEAVNQYLDVCSTLTMIFSMIAVYL